MRACSHDGWYWERLPHGVVAICPPGGKEHVIPPDAWASIVSSVSAGGEEDGRYCAARAFHESKGPVAIVGDVTFPEPVDAEPKKETT